MVYDIETIKRRNPIEAVVARPRRGSSDAAGCI